MKAGRAPLYRSQAHAGRPVVRGAGLVSEQCSAVDSNSSIRIECYAPVMTETSRGKSLLCGWAERVLRYELYRKERKGRACEGVLPSPSDAWRRHCEQEEEEKCGDLWSSNGARRPAGDIARRKTMTRGGGKW